MSEAAWAGGHQATRLPRRAGKGTRMRRVMLIVSMLVAALSHTANSGAQGLPPGGYYADGAYYVPYDSAAAQAVGNRPSACPVGYGVPTVYVASTATMVRIYQVG